MNYNGFFHFWSESKFQAGLCTKSEKNLIFTIQQAIETFGMSWKSTEDFMMAFEEFKFSKNSSRLHLKVPQSCIATVVV